MNPRAATNDLLPFQGSPFNHLGTSAIWLICIPFGIAYSVLHREPIILSSVSHAGNGESGIRTHAPFRTNGFQDRLVMTTSISLQALSQTCSFILFDKSIFVNHFFQVFFIFLNYIIFFVNAHNPLYFILPGTQGKTGAENELSVPETTCSAFSFPLIIWLCANNTFRDRFKQFKRNTYNHIILCPLAEHSCART